jgi:hypothetical protein
MCLMNEPVWNFEQEPHEPTDESGLSLRAYFDRMSSEKMQQYSPAWTDEQVIAWDGNFRDDGALMLVCAERDIEVAEYRKVIEECIRYREIVMSVMNPMNCDEL